MSGNATLNLLVEALREVAAALERAVEEGERSAQISAHDLVGRFWPLLTAWTRQWCRSRRPVRRAAIRSPLAARTTDPSLTPRSHFLPLCSIVNFHCGGDAST